MSQLKRIRAIHDGTINTDLRSYTLIIEKGSMAIVEKKGELYLIDYDKNFAQNLTLGRKNTIKGDTIKKTESILDNTTAIRRNSQNLEQFAEMIRSYLPNDITVELTRRGITATSTPPPTNWDKVKRIGNRKVNELLAFVIATTLFIGTLYFTVDL